MRRIIVLCIALTFFGGIASAATTPRTEKTKEAAVKAAYMKLPLSFVKNEGQKDKSVLFYERSGGHATAFTKEGVALYLGSSEAVTLAPLNASPFTIEATDKKAGKVNYLIGNDPSKWKVNIPTYGAILYKNIYPGIDMKFYGTNSQLEYDLIVSPEGDPSKIRLSYKGIRKLSVTPSGELEITLKEGSLYQKKPHVYQTINGKKVEIEGKFLLADATAYGFTVGTYDKKYPLVIDPVLIYSTYLGGDGDDRGYGIAVDSSGCAYVTGETWSGGFHTTGAYQTTNRGSGDVFVTKLGADGAGLVYSTYLGGSYGDRGYAIAVDSSGHAYVTGFTNSDDFPTTAGAYQTTNRGNGDVFVTKLGADGAGLVYSTCLGRSGNETGYGIAVDSSGHAYVTGCTWSTDFPTTTGAYQTTNRGNGDVFVTKLGADGAGLVYSTYLGGSGNETGYGIAVDSSGYAYVTGETYSGDFPVQGAYQGSRKGTGDVFVTKFAADGAGLVYSTYLGGDFEDYGYGIAVDSSGHAYVTGYTWSTDFPTTTGAFQTTFKGSYDVFVTKLSADGASLAYSTYLGGNDNDTGKAITLDSSGHAYVTGYTLSGNFPTTAEAYQKTNRGDNDVFVTKLSADGASLVYSTYLGGDAGESALGIAVDSSGYVYVTGETYSGNFPTTAEAYQTTNRGNIDVFVTKLGISVLSVSRAGTGSGTVASDTGEIDCGSTCSAAFAPGTGVTLTASASSGSAFTGWSGACTGAGTCVVTMSADTTVTATFMADLTVTASVSGGNGTVSPATQAVQYRNSATITITPDAGRHVSSILDAASSSTGKSVKKGAATTMSKAGASSTGSYVINNVTANHAVTVTFAADSETLTAVTSGNGTIAATGLSCTGSTCTGTYDYNTPVTITATAGSGSTFTGWTGCDSTSSAVTGKAARSKASLKAPKAAGASSSSTCTVTMTGARTVTATFTGNQTLTATKSGTGSGTISGTGLTCTGGTCTGTYDYNTPVTLAATPATGSTFTSWTGCDSTSSNTCTVTMSAAKSVTATFTLDTETLTATRTGNGTLSATGLSCAGSTCTGTYAYNTPVTITAAAATGSTFTSWTGCDSTSGNTCIVIMTSARSVTATFTGNQTLTATKSGTGSGILSASGLSCAGSTCTGTYAYNTPVTITATPATGSTFTSWTGCDSTSSNTCTVTMSAARSVTATFTLSGETLTVTRTGTGTGTLSATGLTCAGSTCTGSYPYGSSVIITAAAGSDSTFTSFSNCDTVSGTTCTVNMTSARNVTALFSAPCTYTASPSWKNFTSKGGSAHVTVKATGTNCASPAISVSDPWITAVMGHFTNNRGSLAVTASPIDSITARTGSVIIHTSAFPITQTGAACNLSFISPAGDTFAPEGGSHSLSVATLTGCGWNVTSSADWLIPDTTSGTGGGAISYRAAANDTGKQRTGKLIVSLTDTPKVKKTFTVRQSPCTILISSTSDSFGNSGGSGSFTVTAPSGCAWSVEADSKAGGWLSAVPGSGTGSGGVSYTALPNATGWWRTGKIIVFLTDTPTVKKVFTVIEKR